MMRAILKLKSEGAQALLTAVLLAGCALNVALLMAYVGRVSLRSYDTTGIVSQTVVALPAAPGAPESAPHRVGRDIAGLVRPHLPRPFRPS